MVNRVAIFKRNNEGSGKLRQKCIQFHTFGPPEKVLQVEQRGISDLHKHDILVRMIASPINPSDLIPVRGSYAHRIPLPNIPGYEGVGIVEQVGSGVRKDYIGKRVLPLRGEGTWQQYVKTSVHHAVEVPSFIDDYTAAQLYINPVTAFVICTETLRLRKGDVIAVNAAGSAIGHIFSQLANILGFTYIAVVRNSRYTKNLLELGASHVIDTSVEPLYETVMEITNGKGVDAAIDSIGGQSGTELAFSVRENGEFLTLGLLSGVQVDWKDIYTNTKVKPTLFHLRHWNNTVSDEKWQYTFQLLIHYINTKQLVWMKPNSFYHINDIQEAVRYVAANSANKGKVMLLFD